MTKTNLGRGLNSLIPPKNKQTSSLPEENYQFNSRAKKESIFNIEVDKIKPNPNQPRQKFYPETLKELSISIKEHGILQPLLVTKVEKENERGREVEYQIISGERRWRAAQIAGLPVVPVIIRDNSAKEKLEMSLIENIQRENLNSIESAQAYRRLIEEFGMSHREVAQRVGKSRVAISNTLRLLDLPEKIQMSIKSGDISEGHGRALLTASCDQRLSLLEKTIKEKMSVRRLEDEARRNGVFTISRRKNTLKEDFILDIEKKLTDHLGTRVSIRQRENAGRLMIDFYSRKELDGISERLSNL